MFCFQGEVRKQFGCGLFIILAAILYSFYETNSERLISFFGFMCSFITVLFFISPLANMVTTSSFLILLNF